MSTSSSASPPPEEMNFQSPTTTSHFMNLASHITSSFSASGGASKRRLPGSAFGTTSSNRDLKSRRRGEPGRLTDARPWEGSKDAGKKEELIDPGLVDQLRKGMYICRSNYYASNIYHDAYRIWRSILVNVGVNAGCAIFCMDSGTSYISRG